MMKIIISVTEFLRVYKATKLRPERIYKLMRSEIRNIVGEYLNELMKAELSDYLGRQPYERNQYRGQVSTLDIHGVPLVSDLNV